MFANRIRWFPLPYMTKHNNEMHVFEIHLFSTINNNNAFITRMHKHLILAVVYCRFLFHASIASKVATENPTGGHGARRPIVPPRPAFSIFLLSTTSYISLRASSKTSNRVSKYFLFFVSSLVSSHDGSFSIGRFAADRSL